MNVKKSPGVTLTELMVAVAIISIAALGMIGSFQAIAVGVQHAKMRTLAANLAQEKMQMLRQASYYRLLVTSNTAYDTSFSPAIAYDTSYYPPETILEGGTYFERRTHVQLAAESGGAIISGATSDSGMKMATVTVTWRQGREKKKLQLQSVKSNPKGSMMSSTISGTVRNGATNTPIEEALVTIAENMGWQDSTKSNGEYSINVYGGNYSLVVTAAGYFTSFKTCAVAENQTLSGTDFYLSAMSSGTVTGSAWINDHIVISQVVGSTTSALGFDQEYVELYNPTTSYVALFAGNTPLAPLCYQNKTDAAPQSIALVPAVFNAGIAANGYFLIANTTTISACGVTKVADAYYDPMIITDPDVIKSPDAGGVGISAGGIGTSGPPWYDCVGWARHGVGHSSPLYEGTDIDQTAGFTTGEQYVRRTSTHDFITSGWGRSYDTENNDHDFIDIVAMVHPPKNSTDVEPTVAGRPAVGAIISCNDGLSLPRVAEAVGNPPYARVLLPNVATGTWTMAITSGTHTVELSSVRITANGDVVQVPNAVTTPAWSVVGCAASMLNDVSDRGYISGKVTNAFGASISPAIKVSAGNTEAEADTASGRFIIPLSAGTYSLVANPGNGNAQYVSLAQDNVAVELGKITSGQDFALSKGGSLRAWVTRDRINPIPGVAVVAIDHNGSARAQDVSKSDGSILLVNLATGTYTVKPILDSGETSSPDSQTAIVAAGATIFASTFTISGAFGSISGQVTSGAKPIATGVLIMASTATLVTPPTINTGMAAGSALYTTNSYENGTYVLDVRGSSTTPYNVRAFYPVPNGSSFMILSASATSVSVNQGQKVTGINFNW